MQRRERSAPREGRLSEHRGRKCLRHKIHGKFLPEYENVDGIMAFYRKDESKCILVAANFGKDAATIKLKSEIEKVWLSNRIDGTVDSEKDSLNLRSCEVVVLELENHK